jgi:hypothetical protein
MKFSLNTTRWSFAFEIHPVVAAGLLMGSSTLALLADVLHPA